jgi:hypothetical protein
VFEARGHGLILIARLILLTLGFVDFANAVDAHLLAFCLLFLALGVPLELPQTPLDLRDLSVHIREIGSVGVEFFRLLSEDHAA